MPRNFGLPPRVPHQMPLWPFVALVLAAAVVIALGIFVT